MNGGTENWWANYGLLTHVVGQVGVQMEKKNIGTPILNEALNQVQVNSRTNKKRKTMDAFRK